MDKNRVKCRWCNWTTAIYTTGPDGKPKATGWKRLDDHAWEKHEEFMPVLRAGYAEHKMDETLEELGLDPFEAYADRCACGSGFGPNGECPNCEALYADDEPIRRL